MFKKPQIIAIGVIGIIILIQVCAYAFPCAIGEDCSQQTEIFGFIPNTLLSQIIIGTGGILLVLFFLFLIERKKFWKTLWNYLVDASFLIASIMLITKYLHPIIIMAITDKNLFESYRGLVFFSGLLLIIFGWYIRDKLKFKKQTTS